jgi:cobalt/nickel transport system ATP-binding protein
LDTWYKNILVYRYDNYEQEKIADQAMMNTKTPKSSPLWIQDQDSPAIHIQDLQYAYPDGMEALCGVNTQLRKGEKVALVGPNGAGKSTLLVHLNGILEKQAGMLSICGLEMNKKNIAQIRALVGLVFQSPEDQLFSPTVYEDVAFGPIYQGLPPEIVRRRVDEALQQVHMEAYSGRVSHHLSVGEKKRIAIATVLSMYPEILVLDEPSAGLDPRARRSLIDLLRELPQTMLVATHDLPLVKDLLPRTIIMDHGAIAADGPTSEILNDRLLLETHGLEMIG